MIKVICKTLQCLLDKNFFLSNNFNTNSCSRSWKLKEYCSLHVLININDTAYSAAASHTQFCTYKETYSAHVNYFYSEAQTIDSILYTTFNIVDKATFSLLFSVKEILKISGRDKIPEKCTECGKYCILNQFIVMYQQLITWNIKRQKLEKQVFIPFTLIVWGKSQKKLEKEILTEIQMGCTMNSEKHS